MDKIEPLALSRRIAASPLNAAVAVGLLIAILAPATLEPPQAAQSALVTPEKSDAATIRAEAEAFGGYRHLVAYISARLATAAGAEAADLENLRLMLDGYRELHQQVGGLLRGGQARRHARRGSPWPASTKSAARSA